jgi:hypothetical protein
MIFGGNMERSPVVKKRLLSALYGFIAVYAIVSLVFLFVNATPVLIVFMVLTVAFFPFVLSLCWFIWFQDQGLSSWTKPKN